MKLHTTTAVAQPQIQAAESPLAAIGWYSSAVLVLGALAAALGLPWPALWRLVLFLLALPWLAIFVLAGRRILMQLAEMRDGRPAGESVRLVYVRGAATIEGLPREDLAAFIRAVWSTGDWTQRSWRGQRLPSGATCDNTTHAALMRILVNAGLVADYGERRTGRLVGSVDEALNAFGLN